MTELSDTITFLGTAGARSVVIRQFLAPEGAWLELGGTQILVDPGPGSPVQVARKKLARVKLDVLSRSTGTRTTAEMLGS